MLDNRLSTSLLVVLLIFMELLDTSIINTSLPNIAASLHVSSMDLRTSIASYLISVAIFTPISGYVTDKFGAKNTLSLAVVIFAISSLCCGLSANQFELAIFRGIQGIGASMMTPVGRIILLKIYNSEEIIKVTSYITFPVLLGPIIGPLLGGYLTTYYTWHWIFFINIPVGFLALIGIRKLVPDLALKNNPRFNWLGFSLIGIGFACLNFTLETMNDAKSSHAKGNLLLTLGTLALLTYCLLYKFFDHKILKLGLLKLQNFRISIVQTLITMIATGGIGFLLPVILQKQFWLSPWQSGLLTFPIAVGSMLMKPWQSKIYRLVGFDRMLFINPILLGLSLACFYIIEKNLDVPGLIVIEVIYGMLLSIQINLNGVGAFRSMLDHEKSSAASFQSTIMLFAMSLSIGITGLIFISCLKFNHLQLGNPSQFTGVLHSFHLCVTILGIISALAGLTTHFDLKLCKTSNQPN